MPNLEWTFTLLGLGVSFGICVGYFIGRYVSVQKTLGPIDEGPEPRDEEKLRRQMRDLHR